MEDAIRKSDVLIEALPYIKSYKGKVFIIKYGGSALIDPGIRRGVLEDIVFMSYVGIRPVLVHGGGPFINEELRRLNRKIDFIDGLRVTPKEDMEIVDKVLSLVNRNIIEDINGLGGAAVSLNTLKKDVIKARPHEKKDLGFVGEIEKIRGNVIEKAMKVMKIPVVSPVGLGPASRLYNVNADNVSSEIAVSLGAAKLVLLTDVKGIMRQKGEEDTLIPALTLNDVEEFIEKGVIQSGMIPKVKACVRALKGRVSKAHIIDGRISHSLLLEIFTDKGIGTEIVL